MAIFIDKDKCFGCDSCIVACKLEHNLPPHPEKPPLADPKGPELIRVYRSERETPDGKVYQYFQPIPCMHCLDAPCIKECPQSAIYKDTMTGITLVDQDKCIGCKLCLSVCPFGSPQFYNEKMYLCDLCIHRITEKGKIRRKTACEAACPAGIIHVGTTEEISALKAKKLLNSS